jgi:beta-lactamase family protein
MMRAVAGLVLASLLLSVGPAVDVSAGMPARGLAGKRLAIQKQGSRFVAVFRIRTRVSVRARVRLRLRARPPWPEGRWRTVRRWHLARRVKRGAHRLRLWAPGTRAICHRHADCQLRATASFSRKGKRPVRRRARRAVATGLWEPKLDSARRYARHRGDVSFAIVDLRSRLRGFRKAHTSASASVIKATLLAAYLRQSSVRARRLRGDEIGLLGPMITVSDNGAAAQVAALLGGSRVERFARKAVGMRDFRWIGARGNIGGSSRISARDEALFFHRFDRYVPDRHRRYARHLLGSVVSWQRWGIGRASPHGWRLYLKGGWGISDGGPGTVNHQVAFLERGRCRIALAILTKHNSSHAYGIETLRGVASRLLHGIGTAPCGRIRRGTRSSGRGAALALPAGRRSGSPALQG